MSTRWLSLGICLDRVLNQWEPLHDFFKDKYQKIKRTVETSKSKESSAEKQCKTKTLAKDSEKLNSNSQTKSSSGQLKKSNTKNQTQTETSEKKSSKTDDKQKSKKTSSQQKCLPKELSAGDKKS